jgi:hypothetical protein
MTQKQKLPLEYIDEVGEQPQLPNTDLWQPRAHTKDNYSLDFAVYCDKGNIDIETDGDTYHVNPEGSAKDNIWTIGYRLLFSRRKNDSKISLADFYSHHRPDDDRYGNCCFWVQSAGKG